MTRHTAQIDADPDQGMVGISVPFGQGKRTPLSAVPRYTAKRSTWGVESLASVVEHMIRPMNVERLHTITETLRLEIEQTGIVSKMQRLATGLQEMVNQPQQPQSQQAVSDVLTELRSELPAAPSESFSPSWRQTLEEIGVADLFGVRLLESIDQVVSRNEMTPSVALSEIQPYVTRIEELDLHLGHLIAAFLYLQIPTEDLLPGEVEVSVLIPRLAVDNDLPDLAKELLQLQRIFGPFVELATGSRPDLKVRSIASSDFGVYLEMVPKAAMFLAVAIERMVALYSNVLDIRLKRQELADSGVPASALVGIEDHARDAVKNGIEEEIERLAAEVGDIGDRINELRIDLRNSLNAIANRIDKGYNFDVRAEPEQEDEENLDDDHVPPVPTESQIAVNTIRSVSAGLKFIAPAGQPILGLPEGIPSDDVPKTKPRPKPRSR